VPASSTSPQKPGQDVDKLLAQRYGRPRVLADASLKPEAYDEDIALAIADVARIYPVPPALVKAVIRRESNFNPNAVSQVGAIGLMQLMPYTAKKVGLRISDLWVPKKNILGGTRLLSALLQYYDGDVIGALSAYNARPREPLAPLPKNGETPEYVQAVLHFYEEYNGAPLQRSGTSLDAPLRPGR
jgi:soluble lytic murein transglycosylase-like protein